MSLGATRTVVATAALILIVFVVCFLVVSYSRLSPGAGSSRRSRHIHIVRRHGDFKADHPHRQRHVIERAMVQAPRGSKTGIQSTYVAPRFKTKPSTAGDRKVAEETENNASTTNTTNDQSAPIHAAGSRYRKARNASSYRLEFRSQKQIWKSNETIGKFKRQLKHVERATLMMMFSAVTRALRASNVTFWMDGGTLLGSYRHHGLIPWDDDVDLVLHRAQKRQARRVIDFLAPAYQLFVEKNANGSSELAWRVFARNASVPVTRNPRFRFPTVDLHFYATNATHVWLEPRNLWWWLAWRRSTVFPLLLRPFSKYWAPAPCNTRTYLITEFDADVMKTCKSPRTSHREDIGQRSVSVPCRLLRRVPLVSRQYDRGAGTVTETLTRAGKTLHQRVIRRHKC